MKAVSHWACRRIVTLSLELSGCNDHLREYFSAGFHSSDARVACRKYHKWPLNSALSVALLDKHLSALWNDVEMKALQLSCVQTDSCTHLMTLARSQHKSWGILLSVLDHQMLAINVLIACLCIPQYLHSLSCSCYIWLTVRQVLFFFIFRSIPLCYKINFITRHLSATTCVLCLHSLIDTK